VPDPIVDSRSSLAAEPGSVTPRRVLVTGGAQRLGREIALAMARAGWDVAVHYGRSQREALATVADIQAIGRQAVAVQADLADEASVSALFDAARTGLGDLDCVVNNASRFEPDRPETFAYDQLQAHMAPNLAAPLLLARRLYALHAGRTGSPHRGVVVNVLDQKLENLNPDFLSYTLSKAALHSATRMLAMAFAPVLRVVAVSPGITLRSGDQTAEAFEQAHRQTPLGRSSTPGDIADAVVFLANAPAITGVNLTVDGGQHLLPLPRDVMYLTGNPPQ
jgi:NAD(P)-dependent dehydrogenase (short-subunit alcohol dehydrogenase family)